jgi:hypothetical protein
MLEKPKKAPFCLIFSQAQDAFQGSQRALHLVSPLWDPLWTAPFSASQKPRGAPAPLGARQFRPMFTAFP